MVIEYTNLKRVPFSESMHRCTLSDLLSILTAMVNLCRECILDEVYQHTVLCTLYSVLVNCILLNDASAIGSILHTTTTFTASLTRHHIE